MVRPDGYVAWASDTAGPAASRPRSPHTSADAAFATHVA
ncbi:hypothetical protein [Streptomyces okerensis]